MVRRILKVFGFVVVCIVAALVVFLAIGIQFATVSSGGTLATGRSVTTEADSWYVGMECSDDTATIRTAGRTIVVAPTQLSIDGKQVAVIDKNVAAVEVTVRGGEVSFTADGQPVVNARR